MLNKVVKIFASMRQILRQKCIKFDFAWAPRQTPLGELTALPRLLAGFKGRGGRGWVEKEGKGTAPFLKAISTPLYRMGMGELSLHIL